MRWIRCFLSVMVVVSLVCFSGCNRGEIPEYITDKQPDEPGVLVKDLRETDDAEPVIRIEKTLISELSSTTGIEYYEVSPDGRRVAYSAREGDSWFFVIDGVRSGDYAYAGNVVFSPDSRHVACTASTGDSWVVIIDGKETARYRGFIDAICFNPDSSSIVYTVYSNGKWLLVKDGEETPAYDAIYVFGFSRDGLRFAYAASEGDGWFAVADGIQGKKYQEIIVNKYYECQCGFSYDSQQFTFLAVNDDRYLLVENGIESEPFDSGYDVDNINERLGYRYVTPVSFPFSHDETIQAVIQGRSMRDEHLTVGENSTARYERVVTQVHGDTGDRLSFWSNAMKNSWVMVNESTGTAYDATAGEPIRDSESHLTVYRLNVPDYLAQPDIPILGNYETVSYCRDASDVGFSQDCCWFITPRNGEGSTRLIERHDIMMPPSYEKTFEEIVITAFQNDNGQAIREIPADNPVESGIITLDNMQATLKAMLALRPTDYPFDRYGSEEETRVDPADLFDINDYFTVLTHLSMEPGYVLDYFLVGDDLFGDCPLIYTRKADDEPFTSYEQYFQEYENSKDLTDIYSFVGFVMGETPDSFQDKIRIDDSAEGFIEYVMLQIMGNQFYLFWHALYNDATVIFDADTVEQTLAESFEVFGDNGFHYEELAARAQFIKLQPTVRFDGDTVIVSVVYFTKWGGFKRAIHTINRYYPHTITDVTIETLIEYECGVQF